MPKNKLERKALKKIKFTDDYIVNFNLLDMRLNKEVYKTKGIKLKKFKELFDEVFNKYN